MSSKDIKSKNENQEFENEIENNNEGECEMESQSSEFNRKFHEFYINDPMKNKKEYNHKNNYVSTTKYNCITFLPKSLALQFSRLPNIYFLFIAIIQSIPSISPLTNVTAILPLIFVLMVSMTRELIEDLHRYKFDKMSNNKQVLMVRNNRIIKNKGKYIEVGDLIIVNENEEFPCDMILLDSSNTDGVCYIETASLDGEKNLKTRFPTTYSKGKYIDKFLSIKGYENVNGNCTCDTPSPDLNKFDGKMNFYKKKNDMNEENENVVIAITINQLLLKGALLRQTKKIIGIACYTGHNNKIILNSKKPKMKLSHLECLMSKYLIGIFIFQLLFCIICSICHNHYFHSFQLFYQNFIFVNTQIINESFLSFFTYLLLLNTMIPISLIVTLEIVKVIQGFFIGFDCELYSKIRKVFCKANSVSIIEELGKINYLFTDKTGTLTCNKMNFKFCVIGDLCYEYVSDGTKDVVENPTYLKSSNKEANKDTNNKISQNKRNVNGVTVYNKFSLKDSKCKNMDFNDKNNEEDINNSKNNYEEENNYNSNSSNMEVEKNINDNNEKNSNNLQKKYEIEKENYNLNKGKNYENLDITDKSRFIKSAKKNENNEPIKMGPNFMYNYISSDQNKKKEHTKLINEFWHALALGNECIAIEKDRDKIEYNGLSPDDIVLVKQAKDQGFSLEKSPSDKKILCIGKKFKESFKILNLLSFTSERKRMSIIVENEETGEIKIYIKGADSEIKKRLQKNTNETHYLSVNKYTNFYSARGMRTLYVGVKTIKKEEYEEWLATLKNAELDLENKKQKVDECYNQIENNFLLLGATIVEDKLQDKVPETIRDLRNAGIRIWMLTGDKVDTAENIALSCNLINKEHKCFKIEKSNETNYLGDKNLVKRNSKNSSKEINNFFIEFSMFLSKNYDKGTPFSIIIESNILNSILYDKEKSLEFLEIAIRAKSCICCRVSPLQKSQIVNCVKKLDKNNICLAIGDGGNDVSMILEADVGVGIYGEEGMLAVQSSDFSIGEFKFLERLLFFHGRNSLNRTSNMILYFFYKNFVFTIVQFFYCFYSLASGQSIIDDWFITLFNLVFTSLPLAVQALTDFDVLETDNKFTKVLMPFLYKESNTENTVFTLKSQILYLTKGCFFSFINFFIALVSVKESALDTEGTYGDLWFCSLSLFTNIIFIVSVTLSISNSNYVWIFPVVLVGTSFMIYYAFCLYVHIQSYFKSYCAVIATFKSTKFHLLLVLIAGISTVMDLTSYYYHYIFGNTISTELMRYRHEHEKYNSPLLVKKYNEIEALSMMDSERGSESIFNSGNSSMNNSNSDDMKNIFDNDLSKNYLKNEELNQLKYLNSNSINTNKSKYNSDSLDKKLKLYNSYSGKNLVSRNHNNHHQQLIIKSLTINNYNVKNINQKNENCILINNWANSFSIRNKYKKKYAFQRNEDTKIENKDSNKDNSIHEDCTQS